MDAGSSSTASDLCPEPPATRRRTESGASVAAATAAAAHATSTMHTTTSATSVAAAESSGARRGDGSGIRDELACIGEQIKALQVQLSSSLTPESSIPDAAAQSMWSLLWRLRPFLYLASPSAARQWRIGGPLFDVYHRGHYAKDAAHVAIALRLYLVVLRFTVVCPAAALHGCLTLLGVLAALNDPRLRSWRDTSERLLDGFVFVARALRSTERDVFTQLVNVAFELLAEVTSYFNGETGRAEGGAAPTCALYLRLAVAPTAISTAEAQPLRSAIDPAELDELAAHALLLPPDTFATCTCVETLYEARCIQASLLRFVRRLSEERLILSMTPDRVALLCDVACHLVSSAVPGVEGGAVNRVQHEAAWHTLQHLATADGRLLSHVEGPLLVAVLVAQWGRGSARACVSVYDVTDAELSLFGWCAGLADAELDALVAAAFHRGGAGLDGRGVAMEWLVCMWELAVHWAVELFGGPEAAAWLGKAPPRAARMLQEWVSFCERFFASAVAFVRRGTDAAREVDARSWDDEYAHQLQLLATELPLASMTASLLCTQVPPAVADLELLLLPRRILTFFQVPDVAAYVAQVVAQAKNCVDVSAYRLLEANALAVQACLRAPAPSAHPGVRCDAAAFRQALTETLQVVEHHEKPSYPLLVQALLVLVHAFPRGDTRADEPAKADAVARAIQGWESAVLAPPHKSHASLGVAAPLLFLLYRETAQVLFSAGTGLGWTRRLLATAPSPSPATSATWTKTSAVFLGQAAGLAAALWQSLTEVLGSNSSASSSAARSLRGGRLSATASGSLAEPHAALRRTYDAFAAHLPVAAQVLQTAAAILPAVHRDAAPWFPPVAHSAAGRHLYDSTSTVELDGVVGSTTAAVLCRSLAGVLTCLLDAKYRFACLSGQDGAAAAQHSETRRSPPVDVPASHGAAPQLPAPAPAPAVAVVVDVDDDDDNAAEHNNGAKEKPARRQRRTTRGNAEGSAAQGPQLETSAQPSATAPPCKAAVSRTQQLERLVQLNGSLLVRAAIAAARHVVLDRQSGPSNLPSARAASKPVEEGEERSNSAGCADDTVSPHKELVASLRHAVLRLAYASVALSPAHCSADGTRVLFDLAKLRLAGAGSSATSDVCRCALRELLLWCPSLAPSHPTTMSVALAANTRVLLLELSGGEALWHKVLGAKREGHIAALADAGQPVLELLRRARRFFGRGCHTAVYAASTSVVARCLSDDALELQARCMATADSLVQEGVAWLGLCFDLYAVYRGLRTAAAHDHNDVALAVMGLCVETARDVMAMFAWSATDLLRLRTRPFVFSSFFKAVVDKEDRDMRVVLSSSLDVLGRYIVSAGAEDSAAAATAGAAGAGTYAMASTSPVVPGEHTTRARLRHLMEQEKIADWRTAAGAVAYVLYECGTKPAAKQAAYLSEAMSYVSKSIKDVPALVRSAIHFIAFDIVSLEADAQMLAREQRRRSGRGTARRANTAASALAASRVVGCVLGGDAARLFTSYEAAGTSAEEDEGGAPRRPREAQAVGPQDVIDDDEDSGTDVLDGIAFSVFERALEQLVTLGEGAEEDGGVEAALRKPVARKLAAEELRKNMFAVLDAVYKAIRMEPAPVTRENDGYSAAAATAAGTAAASSGNVGGDGGYEEEDEADAVPGSLRARRRWLLGLASFIRFMGPQTTPIALMLPTLLSRCAKFRSLLPLVCIVWRELVCACEDEYLTESAASIVLSLLSLEQHAALGRGSKALLLDALSHLYTRTETAAFWDSYKVVLGTFSELVRTVLHARLSVRAEAAAVSPAQEGDAAATSVLLTGFVTVMQSGSLQSATVFVRALHQYLCSADAAARQRLSSAAAAHPAVLQTLLRCSEVDGDGALYAMRCISILGAVATPQAASGATTSSAAETEGQRASLTTSPASAAATAAASAGAVSVDVWSRAAWTQSRFLDAETVLNWRKFAFTLLKDYFPRVFASTADPVLHNRIAFAVQELIRAATRQERLQLKGVELRREDVVHVDELERYLWWTRLTKHVKQLLGGFTTTRYALTVNWTTQPRDPEYTPALAYRRWLFAFFNHLTALCEGWFAEMVQPLRNVAKKSAALVLGLLPYLVVHLLESGRETDVQYIRGEVMAVLEATAGDDRAAPVSLRSQSIYEATPETAPAEEPREHAHTVLSVLEDVEQLRWTLLRHRGRIPCVFEEQEQTENLCVRLAEVYGAFVASIPWALRCRAALRIGSHVRALRSVEGQRRIPKLPGVIAEVTLQHIFAALDDRESSRAVHRALPRLSLEETAFSLENNGDWLAALGSAELVLQHRPSSGQHQLTALHCMNELGELYMTSRYAASLLAAGAQRTPDVCAGDGDSAMGDRPGRPALASSTTFSQLNAEPLRVPAVDAAQLRRHVQSYANEAAWRLGQWDALLPSSTAATSLSTAGGLPVSLAMPAAQLQRALTGSGSLAHVCRVTDGERAKVVPLVRTPCQEDLAARGYAVTLLLHALGDVDAVAELCAGAFVEGTQHNEEVDLQSTSQASAPLMKLDAPLLPSSVKEAIPDLLSRRESHVEETIAAREPLLALHRLIYRELRMPQRVAQTWLKQAELLRDGGLGEAALTAARQAAFECPDHVAETEYYALVANLLHDTQAPTPAMEFVRECLEDRRVPAKMRAKLQMLRTNWLIETGSEPPDRVVAEYQRALEYDAKSELVHHQLALFYDRLNTLATNASEGAVAQRTAATSGVGAASSTGSANVSAAAMYDAALQHQREMVHSIHAHVTRAVEHYGEALRRGVETASVSLPRMLTLWLDSAAYLGGVLSTTAGKLDGTASAALEELNSRLRDLVLSTVKAVIPPAVVMGALPQLLSRLGHPVAAVRGVLTDIVLHLLSLFPQQCLWLVLPMALSKEGPKEVVETQIIKPFADNPRNERVLRHAKMICDTLLTICNCSASLFPKDKGLTQLNPVQKITPMLPAARFIVPVLSNLTPNTGAGSVDAVFPVAPCLHHFDDAVVVMRSLQKPKRIWVHTDDGRRTSFLCKAKDEPRKDIRMMEVAALMNSFFCTDPEAKRKRFALRRYAITALSDDCAIIEWLNDTTPLAKVAMECYSLDRSGVHISAVKKWVALVDEGKLSKRDLFEKYILPEAGPVMHQWLDRTFASNQSWYEARTLFTQSTALWSIAGHIVGLGDRHAENLMIDMERGELMHVDFACMFDKGEKLEVPERVRFRLTQNLTDVMGVLGARGPFQATCEVALRCEMKNKSAVMSIVETLLHEPLVEWRRQSSRSSAANGPKQLMERVARRLDGFLDLYAVPPQRDTLALNVESQVAKLIHHSADLENLSQMYIWWMAWI